VTGHAAEIDDPEVAAALRAVIDPCSAAAGTPMNLVEMGLVQQARIDARGTLHVHLRLTGPSCMMVGFMVEDIQDAVRTLRRVTSVVVATDEGVDWLPSDIAPEAAARRRSILESRLSDPGRRLAAPRT